MIGAASVGDGNRVHAHGLEGLHPFLEDRPGRFVPLQINAAEFAAAVVNVEVNGKFILSGLLEFPRAGFGVATAEVVCDVSARTKQAFFLTGPQSDADGAAHPHSGSFQDAHYFEHHGRADAVVGGARAGVPGIEVAADHNNLVSEPAVRAGNFADDIERFPTVVVEELVLDVEFDGDRNISLQRAVNAVVMLGGKGNLIESRRSILQGVNRWAAAAPSAALPCGRDGNNARG